MHACFWACTITYVVVLYWGQSLNYRSSLGWHTLRQYTIIWLWKVFILHLSGCFPVICRYSPCMDVSTLLRTVVQHLNTWLATITGVTLGNELDSPDQWVWHALFQLLSIYSFWLYSLWYICIIIRVYILFTYLYVGFDLDVEHKIFTLSIVLVLHLVGICNHGGSSASCS